eukprot:c25569_g1_i1 orf=577-867(+)
MFYGVHWSLSKIALANTQINATQQKLTWRCTALSPHANPLIERQVNQRFCKAQTLIECQVDLRFCKARYGMLATLITTASTRSFASNRMQSKMQSS